MNKNKMLTKLLSLVLCLSMALVFVPDFAVAEEGETTEYDGYIVTLKDGSDAEPDGKDLEEIVEGEIYYADSKQDIREELPSGEIESIEPNYEIKLMDAYSPNDPYYQSSKWQQEMIRIQEVWEQNYMGQGINGNNTPVVAVIDTGIAGTGKNPINSKHEDLNYDNILEGYNACSDYPEDFTDDCVNHGTIVTGIIAAMSDNGLGVAGDMPSVKIRPYRCFNKKGKGDTKGEIACIYKAIEDGVDVINISAGNEENLSVEAEAIQAANRKGIIVCAAAGNDGDNTVFYPASHDRVISVASVNRSQVRSSFSNYNKSVDVTAPGESFYGLGIKSSSRYEPNQQGTSFSCPHVTALAALCKSINPDINHDAFLEILKKTSSDIGTEGYDTKYGWGLINFSATLNYMLEGDSSPIYDIKIKKIVPGKKQFKVFWDREVDGTYQMQYSTNEKFTKAARKTHTVSDKKANGVRVYNLKSKKKYYVRIRVKVKTVTKSYYTSWSPVKSIKTK